MSFGVYLNLDWFVVFSRLDFVDSGECDPSEDLDLPDFSEGKLYFDHFAPTILKLFKFSF